MDQEGKIITHFPWDHHVKWVDLIVSIKDPFGISAIPTISDIPFVYKLFPMNLNTRDTTQKTPKNTPEQFWKAHIKKLTPTGVTINEAGSDMEEGSIICTLKAAIYTVSFPRKSEGTGKKIGEFIAKKRPVTSLFTDLHVRFPLDCKTKTTLNKDRFFLHLLPRPESRKKS